MKTLRMLGLAIALLAIGFVAGRTRSVPAAPLITDPLVDATGLTGVRRSISIENVPIKQTLAELAKLYNAPLDADWDALATALLTRETPVTFAFHDLELADALCQIHAPDPVVRLGYKLVGNRILLTTESDAASHVVTRAYDVELLVVTHRLALAEFVNHWMDTEPLLCGTGVGASTLVTDSQPTDAEIAENLTVLIRETIGVGTWREDGGLAGSMRVIGNVLIVTQTPDIHRQIAVTLNTLHEGDLSRIRNRQVLIERLQARDKPN